MILIIHDNIVFSSTICSNVNNLNLVSRKLNLKWDCHNNWITDSITELKSWKIIPVCLCNTLAKLNLRRIWKVEKQDSSTGKENCILFMTLVRSERKNSQIDKRPPEAEVHRCSTVELLWKLSPSADKGLGLESRI